MLLGIRLGKVRRIIVHMKKAYFFPEKYQWQWQCVENIYIYKRSIARHRFFLISDRWPRSLFQRYFHSPLFCIPQRALTPKSARERGRAAGGGWIFISSPPLIHINTPAGAAGSPFLRSPRDPRRVKCIVLQCVCTVVVEPRRSISFLPSVRPVTPEEARREPSAIVPPRIPLWNLGSFHSPSRPS